MSINHFTIDALKGIMPSSLITDDWISDQVDRAAMVKLYREYVDGEHQSKMTTQQRKMLNLQTGDEMNNNYCATVISTMSSRLAVDGMNGDTPEADKWASDLMKTVRFDALQIDVHNATLISGDNYVMVSFDSDTGQPILTNEPAYDGMEGVMVVYNAMGTQLEAAIKVWQAVDNAGDAYARVNVYYPDKVCKYEYGGNWVEIEEIAWMDKGQPIGVPFVHFKNRVKVGKRYGTSEIKQILPLQDALNRNLYSMTMTAELSAFGVRWIKGAPAPAAILPGMIISMDLPADSAIDELAVEWLKAMEVGMVEPSPMVPFIEQAEYIISQIATNSQTPIPELMGSALSSGEALKQRESGLLGKVREFQIKVGNQWEDVFALAQKLQGIFGSKKPPLNEYWTTHWKPAELRNDNELVDRVLKIKDAIPQEEFLRLLAGLFEWDSDYIKSMIATMASEESTRLQSIGNIIPPMGSQDFEVLPDNATMEVQNTGIEPDNQI